jgi:hypothetical protein
MGAPLLMLCYNITYEAKGAVNRGNGGRQDTSSRQWVSCFGGAVRSLERVRLTRAIRTRGPAPTCAALLKSHTPRGLCRDGHGPSLTRHPMTDVIL